MNKLTFREYFTSSFTSRLYWPRIYERLTKLSYYCWSKFQEPYFKIKVSGEALCSEHTEHHVCVFTASSSCSEQDHSQRVLQQWCSSAVQPHAPPQICHLLHPCCRLQQGQWHPHTHSAPPIGQTLPSRECWASPGQTPQLRHSWAAFHPSGTFSKWDLFLSQ